MAAAPTVPPAGKKPAESSESLSAQEPAVAAAPNVTLKGKEPAESLHAGKKPAESLCAQEPAVTTAPSGAVSHDDLSQSQW